MKRLIIGCTTALAVFLLLPTGVPAQETTNTEGYVLTPDGEPIADVEVRMEYKGPRPQTYRTKTDKNGRFMHVRVWEGPYDLTFIKEGLGVVTINDFIIREIVHPNQPPTFRLGGEPTPPEPRELEGLTSEEQAAAAAAAAEATAGALAAELDAANVHLAAGRLDEALAGYEAVVAQAPDLPEVHHNLGVASKRKGDLARAEAEFRKAAELDPDFAEPHGALAVILAQAGKLDEAIVEAEMAVELDPEDTQSLYNLAVMYKDSGKPKEAEAAFLELEELDPDNVEIQFHLGTTLIGMGKMDEAIGRLEHYVESAPADAPNVASAKSMIDALTKAQ